MYETQCNTFHFLLTMQYSWMETSHRGNLNICKKASRSKWQRKFRIWFPSVSITLKSTIHQMVNKFQSNTHNMLFHKKHDMILDCNSITSMSLQDTRESCVCLWPQNSSCDTSESYNLHFCKNSRNRPWEVGAVLQLVLCSSICGWSQSCSNLFYI